MDAESFLRELTVARLTIEAMGRRLRRKDRAARKVIDRKRVENEKLKAALMERMREDE